MRSEERLRAVRSLRYVFSERPSAAQFRGARAMLCVTQAYVAKVSGISQGALCKMENDVVVSADDTVAAVVKGIRKLGVEFTPTGVQFIDPTETDA